MSGSPSRFAEALRLIDQANAEDPTLEDVAGKPVPKELVYGHRMTARLVAFAPDAPEPVRLAARAQHIRRWEIPRDRYPEGRAGYLRWRTDLYSWHGDVAAEILATAGYDAATVDRVRELLRKKQLKKDPDVQLLEDVICLVFLEHYLDAFARKHPEDKVVSILQKTWSKMSEAGHQAALALTRGTHACAWIDRALSEPPA